MLEDIPETLNLFMDELKTRLNKDEKFAKEAKGWKGSLIFTILPDENFPWILRMFLAIDDGKVTEIKLLAPEEKVDATFESIMVYSTFMKLARGNLDLSLGAVLKKKVKLIGSSIEALKKMGMFKAIVDVLRSILDDWRGKTAILLRRAEFKAPHMIMGRNVREFLAGLEAERALIITDEAMVKIGFVDEVKKFLEMNDIKVEVFKEVQPEPPVELVKKAAEFAKKFKPDVIIGLGGGSAMDTAKAVFIMYERPDIDITRVDPSWKLGLRNKARLVLIPTTSGTGSEVTWASVITIKKDGAREKIGIGNREILADYAIIDPFFVYKLPKSLVSSTGLDALVHAVEGLLSPWRNELVVAVAIRAIKLLFKYLPKSYKEGDPIAREKVHYAATLAGLAFGNSQATLCHGLGHAFGATFHKPHGWAVAVFLPYVIDYYRDTAKEVFEELAEELGIDAEDKVKALKEKFIELIKEVDGFVSIKEMGISEEEFKSKIDLLVELSKDDACSYSGPRIPTDEDLRKLYEYAYEGKEVDF